MAIQEQQISSQADLSPQACKFMGLPILSQLALSIHDRSRDKSFPGMDTTEARQLAFLSVYQLNKEQRALLGIKMFSILPLNQEEELDIRYDTFQSYRLSIMFPLPKGPVAAFPLSRTEIGNALTQLDPEGIQTFDDVDAAIASCAQPVDACDAALYSSLIYTVRNIDSEVYLMHNEITALQNTLTDQQSPEQSNLWAQLTEIQFMKCLALSDIVGIAEKLEERYGLLNSGKPLYKVSPDKRYQGGTRLNVEFSIPLENTDALTAALYYGQELPTSFEQAVYFSLPIDEAKEKTHFRTNPSPAIRETQTFRNLQGQLLRRLGWQTVNESKYPSASLEE